MLRYLTLERSTSRASHARRWLAPCTRQACATASRLTSGVTVFCSNLLEDGVVEHGLGQQLLQLGVISTESLRLNWSADQNVIVVCSDTMRRLTVLFSARYAENR